MDPVRGFWMVSLSAFVVSPFLTNDGVCLLFVEPILNAFESLPSSTQQPITPSAGSAAALNTPAQLQLMKSDAIYFLLALACSSNIGSSLTYTGNPQNMIIAGDSLSVMSPLKFLGYMLLPSALSFFVTTIWIQRIWMRSRVEKYASLPTTTPSPLLRFQEDDAESTGGSGGILMIDTTVSTGTGTGTGLTNRFNRRKHDSLLSPHRIDAPVLSPAPLDRNDGVDRGIAKKVVKVIMVPFPYAMLLLMGIMIALIFVDLISISALIAITACVMVVTLVIFPLCPLLLLLLILLSSSKSIIYNLQSTIYYFVIKYSLCSSCIIFKCDNISTKVIIILVDLNCDDVCNVGPGKPLQRN